MRLVDRAIDRLQDNQTISDNIDWSKWLKPSDKARVVPAESLAQDCKQRMMLGSDAEEGITLPWDKTQKNVFIRQGKLVIWTGYSFHGKSQMLKQVMLHAIHRGERVVIASMEEDIREIWEDLARMWCGTPEPTVQTLGKFIEFITGRLWIYDQQGRVEPKRMLAVTRYASAELKVTHSVIDSLMMLKQKKDDYDAQNDFCAELKSVGKDTGQTTHLVAHLKKPDGRNGDKMPGSPHDIAGGHEIFSMADYVFNVWRDKEPEPGNPECVLRVEKQRGKKKWIGGIGLHFHEESRQFTQAPNRLVEFWRSEVGR